MIIILTPELSLQGGVASYVSALKGKWSSKEVYFVRGNRHLKMPKIARLLFDYIRYFLLLYKLNDSKKILVNTSMNKRAFMQEIRFLLKYLDYLIRKYSFLYMDGIKTLSINFTRKI